MGRNVANPWVIVEDFFFENNSGWGTLMWSDVQLSRYSSYEYYPISIKEDHLTFLCIMEYTLLFLILYEYILLNCHNCDFNKTWQLQSFLIHIFLIQPT